MNQIDRIVKVFKAVAQSSTPVSANILKISDSYVNIVSTWSQRNLERKASIQFCLTQTVNLDKKEVSNLGAIETTSEMMSTISKSGIYRAVFRETLPSGKITKKQFLEVWKNNRLWKSVDLTGLEIHGDVYTDSEFGTFEFSPSEESILYVAEKKVPKSEPFISSKSPNKKSEDIIKGSEYLLVEDWGESLVGRSQPVLVVAKLCGGNGKDVMVEVIETIGGDDSDRCEDLCLGQAVWAPDGGIVGVGWDPLPRRLGLVYCTNRPSWIVYISPKGELRKLSKNGLAVRSPQFSPNNKFLVWLERLSGGPHHCCHRLIKYDWESGQESLILDIVEEEIKCANGEPFYGLFNTSLKNCWLPDNKTIILSTPQKVTIKTFLIDTETRTLSELNIDGVNSDIDPDSSQGFLCSKDDSIVCWKSNLLEAPGIYIGLFICPSSSHSTIWIPLIPSTPITHLTAASYTIEKLDLIASEEHKKETTTSLPKCDFSALYLGPKEGKGVPLVVWPHGGPHSCFSNSFSLIATFFASLGFGVLMVNYRGSTGAGQKGVESLLGKVGDRDVRDVHKAAEIVLSSHPTTLDPEKVLLFGGSHGGFLVLHLAARFPYFYKAVVSRNPVTDFASLFSVSDIPDWAMVEAGFSWSKLGTDLGVEVFEKMKKLSPLSFVDSVKAPILLLLGKKDLRVPSHQGLAYYHALRARNLKTKVLMYEDNHPLSQTPHEIDFAINTALWYIEALSHEVEWLTLDGE